MTANTLWDSGLKTLFQTFLIDAEALKQTQQAIAWDSGLERYYFSEDNYPDYYRGQNFHGIDGGYLTMTAAVTYDPITRYVLPPQEDWVRQGLLDRIGGEPRRILDLGCGTGAMTLRLKQKYPRAEVIGLDLSPYMLTFADYQAEKEGLEITWQAGLAEKTSFPNQHFDLITCALLFHETPPAISQAILRESFRLLKPGGQVLILDGNQVSLRQTDWLTQVFEEPYIQAYAQGNLDQWLSQAQFEEVKTTTHWLIHQVSQGRKPHPVNTRRSSTWQTSIGNNWGSIPVG